MSKFKATRIIAEAFDGEGIRYTIEQRESSEALCVGFPVTKGPLVMARFISRDDDNDVAVRVYSLFNDIPGEDRSRALKAINKVNNEMRFGKFCLDDDGDINFEIDVPILCDDSCLGQVAGELFYRTMRIVRHAYEPFLKALYGEDEEDKADEQPDAASFTDFLQRYRLASAGDDEDGEAEDDEAEDDEVEDGEEDAEGRDD